MTYKLPKNYPTRIEPEGGPTYCAVNENGKVSQNGSLLPTGTSGSEEPNTTTKREQAGLPMTPTRHRWTRPAPHPMTTKEIAMTSRTTTQVAQTRTHRSQEKASNLSGARMGRKRLARSTRISLQNADIAKQLFTTILFVALTVSAAPAQGPNATTRDAAAAGQQHGFLIVELAKSLDSKKLKEGDAVEAKLTANVTTGDGTTLAQGSKLTGHVTQAKARSKGDAESALGIVFDKIIGRGGEMTITSVIEAAAPNPNSGADSPVGVSYSGLDEAAAKNSLPVQRSRSVPLLNEESRGVLEIKNLQLGANGVFISGGKEVKLESGMRMLLDVVM